MENPLAHTDTGDSENIGKYITEKNTDSKCFTLGKPNYLDWNGFQKKSQKTPKQEIEKALKIKAEYENEKQEFNDP